MPSSLIPKHGGFRHLLTFQISRLIYDITVRFCDRYISRRSRTHDQMVQAARSGVQNIAEGSVASATSKKTELKLTNVGRASLVELGLDFEDFLRHRSMPIWNRDDSRRNDLVRTRPQTVHDFVQWVSRMHNLPGSTSSYAEISANGALGLLAVSHALLGRQISTLEKEFEEQGGFTEKLYRVRLARRNAPGSNRGN